MRSKDTRILVKFDKTDTVAWESSQISCATQVLHNWTQITEYKGADGKLLTINF